MNGFSRSAHLLILLALLAGGCSEWDKYWERQAPPVGPEPIIDETPPVVRIATPTGVDEGTATPVTGDDYRIVVEASDDVGVRSLLLTVDDGAPAELITSPHAETEVSAEVFWNTTALTEASRHRMSAVATDDAGNQATSETVWAQVFNSGPEVTIAEPLPGALARGSVPVTASFPDGDASIAQVEFLANVWTIDVISSPPWTTTLDTSTLPDGQTFLAVKATTVLDFIGVSPAVGIHVNNGVPSVSLDFPLDGHAVAARGTLTLEASASDAEEGMLPDERVLWTSSLDGALGSGRSLPVSDLSPGSHTVTVTGENAWGATNSATIRLNVRATPTYGYCADIQRSLFEIYLCTWCHDPGYPDRGYLESELDLTDLAGLLTGGKTTLFRTVVPGRPESSFVYNKLSEPIPWVGDPMPNDPAFPTPPASLIDHLRIWIREGAPADDPPDCP